MLFRSSIAPKTWDSWIFYHQGVYYMYYLISDRYVCDGFALATSTDGVNWQDHGWVLSHSDQMVRYLGSGTVWKDVNFEENRRFLCNYSEWRPEGGKNVQHLLFAWSNDLRQWHKLDDSLMFHIDERYYKRIEPDARGPWEDPRWDGISVVPRPESGYYGYWTATPKDFLGFGFGESADGLHWQALEPPRIEWGDTPKMIFIEVGGVALIEGRYYAMLADYASTNCGMFSFVSDSPSGPFRPSARNYSLLRNQSKMHAYFTRFFDSPEGVLVNHHSLAEGQFSDPAYTVYYAPLKKVRIIDEALYLVWWQGNEKLKNREVKLNPLAETIRFDPNEGIILEGELRLPGELLIQNDGEASTGIRVSGQGLTEIGSTKSGWSDFTCAERVDRDLKFGASPRFRLLLNRTMLEFYLNGIFIQCYTMEKKATGMITLQNVNDIQLWQWSM